MSETADRVDADPDAAFLRWLRENGADVGALEWPCVGAATGSRGCVAARDVAPLEPLLRVPESLVVTAPGAREELGVEPGLAPLLAADDCACLAAWLLVHRELGAASRFHAYVRTLPSVHECGAGVLDWSPAELAELQDAGDVLREVRERNAALETEFARVLAECPALAGAQAALRDYHWAHHTVQSRAFGRRLGHLALVPLADALNHGNVPIKYALEGGAFRLWMSGGRGVRRGEEALNSYGRLPNRKLLLDYGFCVLDNEWDFVQVALSVDEDAPFAERRRALLGRAGVRGATALLARDVVPDNLLRFYRVLVATGADLDAVERSPLGVATALSHVVSVENEARALAAAERALQGLLDSAPTSEADDLVALRRATASQARLAAALRYRVGRKRVLRLTRRFVAELGAVVGRARELGMEAVALRRIYPQAASLVLDRVYFVTGSRGGLTKRPADAAAPAAALEALLEAGGLG